LSPFSLAKLLCLPAAVLLFFVPQQTQPLPGTHPLTFKGDLAFQMVEGIHRYLDRANAASIEDRQSLWRPDFSSREAYEASVAHNRERFRKIIGLIDERVPYEAPALDVSVGGASLVASGGGYEVHAVRWPVLPGVDAEGLLLKPDRTPVARVVALPDADWSPEMIVGLAPGVAPAAQFARRLAENGCLVLVPVLIDRKDTWSGNSRIGRFTNQPHREFIYRMAYELGRHIIGYEVQKVLAAVDWFERSSPTKPIGVFGYGDGGLLALHSAAADTRIDVAAVSGYFQSRQNLWQEPIYRNVWGLLTEFGDAEIAGLVAPRTLVIEAARSPEVDGPPPETRARRGATPGRLGTPALRNVLAEVERVKPVYAKLDAVESLSTAVSGEGRGDPGGEVALLDFLGALGVKPPLVQPGAAPKDRRADFDPTQRLHRQFDQLVEFTQAAVRRSEVVRREFWAKADASSIAKWQQSTEGYRRYLWEEVIGKLPSPSEPLVAQTRKIHDEARWAGYEVVLPVWPDVFAYGILLLPKDLEPGERRPVVVCQHGLEGRPQHLIDPKTPRAENYYHHFAARLADRGFVVYAPQNPYIFRGRFRQLLRKAHPLKASLFSFILAQHERTLDWLSQQPFVDPDRIGFYGLSYGGKTAVRVPPLLDRYALSICSADFNEWIWKNTSVDHSFSYMFSREYDMLEFNLGNTFNYAELASLMAPRPFMVERGHKDGVGVDEWVAYEYAKVRRFYTFLGIPERTEIEFFNGPHSINGVGTFRFLHRHLNWPEASRQ
jgi:dienelactone hydrolase